MSVLSAFAISITVYLLLSRMRLQYYKTSGSNDHFILLDKRGGNGMALWFWRVK